MKIKVYTFSESPVDDEELIRKNYSSVWEFYDGFVNHTENFIVLMKSYTKFKHLCDVSRTGTRPLVPPT